MAVPAGPPRLGRIKRLPRNISNLSSTEFQGFLGRVSNRSPAAAATTEHPAFKQKAPNQLDGACSIPSQLRRVRPDQLQARKLAVQEHPSNQARHATRRSGYASMWCAGDRRRYGPCQNAMVINMRPGESTTNHIPAVGADRRETMPYQIIAPKRGLGSDPHPINHPATGLRQLFPSLIPARPYCADVLSDGLKIRERKLAT